MKKNMKNFWLLLIGMGIAGTLVIESALHLFGIVPVFIGCCGITLTAGLYALIKHSEEWLPILFVICVCSAIILDYCGAF
jgi:hypothetical protein